MPVLGIVVEFTNSNVLVYMTKKKGLDREVRRVVTSSEGVDAHLELPWNAVLCSSKMLCSVVYSCVPPVSSRSGRGIIACASLNLGNIVISGVLFSSQVILPRFRSLHLAPTDKPNRKSKVEDQVRCNAPLIFCLRIVRSRRCCIFRSVNKSDARNSRSAALRYSSITHHELETRAPLLTLRDEAAVFP